MRRLNSTKLMRHSLEEKSHISLLNFIFEINDCMPNIVLLHFFVPLLSLGGSITQLALIIMKKIGYSNPALIECVITTLLSNSDFNYKRIINHPEISKVLSSNDRDTINKWSLLTCQNSELKSLLNVIKDEIFG